MQNERCIELITKELSGEINGEEQKELDHLLKTNPEYLPYREMFRAFWSKNNPGNYNNQALFLKIKEQIGEQEALQSAGESAQETIQLPASQPWYFNNWFKAAAAILIISSVILLYLQAKQTTNPQRPALLVKTTMRGVKSIINLPDGTRITLNADSKLEYPEHFSGKIREVNLTGEAFFDVHKDAQHPFIIHTGNMNIKVLGTAFNVKAYPNDASMETTLIRGQIAVTFNGKNDEPIILLPSQKLVVSRNPVNNDSAHAVAPTTGKAVKTGPSLTTLTYYKPQDTTVVETSWLQNKLVFKNEDFVSIAQEMERWYNTNIRFENDAVKQLTFTGKFDRETIEEALRALQLSDGGFTFKKDTSGIIIY
jgi:ferric-dicitrate binding protein FerR (iron transport regulator)